MIYYHWVSHDQCDLVYAYAKNVAADLTKIVEANPHALSVLHT